MLQQQCSPKKIPTLAAGTRVSTAKHESRRQGEAEILPHKYDNLKLKSFHLS